MSDIGFEQMLAQFNQDFKDAQEFSDWMPPDGEYYFSVVKVDKGTKVDDSGGMGWWKLTCRIEKPEDADLNGKEFNGGFYSTKNLGILKATARTLNGGVQIDSLAEADSVLTKSVGLVLLGTIVTTISKKNGQEYTNCRIKEVIPVTATETPTEPPQG